MPAKRSLATQWENAAIPIAQKFNYGIGEKLKECQRSRCHFECMALKCDCSILFLDKRPANKHSTRCSVHAFSETCYRYEEGRTTMLPVYHYA